MNEKTNSETLLEFPCDFPIKAMGLNDTDFDLLIAELVRKHAPDFHEGAVQSKPSSNGKYTSITITITATSKAQLDAIYQSLSDHERVLMAL